MSQVLRKRDLLLKHNHTPAAEQPSLSLKHPQHLEALHPPGMCHTYVSFTVGLRKLAFEMLPAHLGC
jgi:hypothetical protein